MNQRYTHVQDVPLALGVFLASDFYDHNDDPLVISTTTLLKTPRQIILPGRLPPSEGMHVLADMMSNRLGAAIHDGIERSWKTNHVTAMAQMGYPSKVIDRILINPDPAQLTADSIPIYLEQRLHRQLGRWTVTGKFDFIGEGIVQDFKSTSVWAYQNQVNANKQILQGSIYRWLDPVRITSDHMEIHHIFMDWRAAQAKASPSSYPDRRFKSQSFSLLSLGETEHYISTKIKLIDQLWDAPEDELPLCSDEDLWRSKASYKYYADPLKTKRSTKNFPDKQEAYFRLSQDGGSGIVKEVPGQVRACHYCQAFALCSQKDLLIANGELLL
jgi:hypothetical protein